MFNFTICSNKYLLIKVIFAFAAVLLYCQYLMYYIVLMQCKWPTLEAGKADPDISPPGSDEKPVFAMFLSDTHLLGSREGYWLDKLFREWQMHRTFQTAMTIHKPDVVIYLMKVSGAEEFESYIVRFQFLFSVPKNTLLYVMSGNHDIGFHYVITPYLNQRFIDGMKAPSVERFTIGGNHFVLINSMAFEGDGCFLCRPAEVAVRNISKHLKCAKDIRADCNQNNEIQRYSRPILLQHFPLYRESDEICNELDEAPAEIKDIKFREKWECLSKEATKQLLEILNPRLVVDGHTHHGCRKIHKKDILEITIPSFSWRNKNNPSFLLGIFTPNNYAVSKCYMPIQSTVIMIYIFSIIFLTTYVFYRLKPRFFCNYFRKLY